MSETEHDPTTEQAPSPSDATNRPVRGAHVPLQQEPVRIVDNRGKRRAAAKAGRTGATPVTAILDEMDLATEAAERARTEAVDAQEAQIVTEDYERRERLARLREHLDMAQRCELVKDDIYVDDLRFLIEEVERLREGADLTPKPDDSWPNIGQWIQHFVQSPQPIREGMVARALQDGMELQQVVMDAHAMADELHAARVRSLFTRPDAGLVVPGQDG